MEFLVREKNYTALITVDSAGTSAYHTGEPADSRMQRHAALRGYELTSRARQFTPADFESFDMIIAQDRANLKTIQRMDTQRCFGHKIFLMTDFCLTRNDPEVPDPFYGGSAGFERVLDILEDACRGCLEYIEKDHR
jgi:protein-tyrosine phosphatase